MNEGIHNIHSALAMGHGNKPADLPLLDEMGRRLDEARASGLTAAAQTLRHEIRKQKGSQPYENY